MDRTCRTPHATGFTVTTDRDSYDLEQECGHVPAMGHHFGPKLVCDHCAQTWEEQQDTPTVCPELLARLQWLEDLEKMIANQKQAQNTLRKELRFRDAQIAILRDRRVDIPTPKEIAKWEVGDDKL